MKYIIIYTTSLMLLGCPLSLNDSYCEEIMVCQEEKESYCDRNLDGCGENCYYYVVESCWQECKGDTEGENNANR